jgi:CheY-like chemotaxis protein
MRDHHGVFTLRLSHREFTTEYSTATTRLSPGHYLIVDATDTGCGIDEPTKQRVFDPFFTTKAEGEGTGLGLSVVRAIVEGHKGGIDLESEVGRGSTFRLYLPVIAGVALPATSDEEPFTPRIRARGETIAVIDDDEALVSVTERALQSLGYSTLAFRSAESFHATFTTAPSGIHLLVSDQTMPGMTGLELGRRLRQSGHQLPILLMTGFSKQLRPESLQQLGRATLLRKPFDRAALARAIRELLDAA